MDHTTIPVTVKGVELSPDQALEYLDQGYITEQDYISGVEAGMQVFAPGWKMTQKQVNKVFSR